MNKNQSTTVQPKYSVLEGNCRQMLTKKCLLKPYTGSFFYQLHI